MNTRNPHADPIMEFTERLINNPDEYKNWEQKETIYLLFALQDAWPYVNEHCTIDSKRNNILALIRKHGEFAVTESKPSFDTQEGRHIKQVISDAIKPAQSLIDFGLHELYEFQEATGFDTAAEFKVAQSQFCIDEGCPHHGTKHICVSSTKNITEETKPELTNKEEVVIGTKEEELKKFDKWWNETMHRYFEGSIFRRLAWQTWEYLLFERKMKSNSVEQERELLNVRIKELEHQTKCYEDVLKLAYSQHKKL